MGVMRYAILFLLSVTALVGRQTTHAQTVYTVNVDYVPDPAADRLNFDGDPSDGICDTGNATDGFTGRCTLSAALGESEDGDIIRFDPSLSVIFPIALTELPNSATNLGVWVRKNNITIDGLIGTSRRMIIDFSLLGRIFTSGADCFHIEGLGATFKNLEIRNCNRFALYFSSANSWEDGRDATIQRNYIHDNTGGIWFYDARNSKIGGPTPVPGTGLGNIISANGTFGGIQFETNKIGGGPSIADCSGTTVEGNLIGADLDGPAGNGGLGILTGCDGLRIGGPDPLQRNIISNNGFGKHPFSSNSGSGIDVRWAERTVIQGNYIGTDPSGQLQWGNAEHGIHVLWAGLDDPTPGSGGTIGGAQPGAGNIISNNGKNGVLIESDRVVVENNIIGTGPGKTEMFANAEHGIRVLGDDTRIGSFDGENPNIIAYNGLDGVFVQTGTGNAISGNNIFGNEGIGVNLDEDEDVATRDLATSNDEMDTDVGANNLQNTPKLNGIDTSTGEIALSYTVDSDPANSDFPLVIEFFAADDDFEEGKTLIDTDVFTPVDFSGCGMPPCDKSITLVRRPGAPVTVRIVSTARDANGNTSEFSGAPLNVNSTGDLSDNMPGDGKCDTGAIIQRDGMPEPECTLRAAIEETNAGSETNVAFNIPGNGPHVIDVLTLLPNITSPSSIDASTQPGYSDSPIVELTTLASISGLTVTGGGTTLRGLSIHSFVGSGIRLEGGGNNIVEGNYIGTDASGTVDKGNQRGIQITNSFGNTIGGTSAEQRNLISGNTFSGIQIDGAGSTSNTVQGNYIGTTRTGMEPLGNSDDAVRIFGGATDNLIGGSEAGEGNVISGNGDYGVYIIGASNNRIFGNLIGVDANGGCTLDGSNRCSVRNGFGGILFEGEITANQIGGMLPGSGNVISGNNGPGITVQDAANTETVISGNKIGVDLAGTAALKNAGEGILIKNASGVTIGGPSDSESNLISENALNGLHIKGGAVSGIQVFGNEFGRAGEGETLIMNGDKAIRVSDGASGVTIGGFESGEANHIRGGIYVTGDATRQVTVQSNVVEIPRLWIDDVNNMRVPMQMDANGPACHAWIGGPGPNNGISSPRILRLGTVVVEGMARPGETVEAFEALNRGFFHGRYFPRRLAPLGNAMADADGHFSIAIDVSEGTWVSVTATDSDGNTSEFSQLRRPVLVAPGIGGSWLKGANGDFVWLPIGTSDASNDLLVRMAMNPNGTEAENLTEDGILEFVQIPPPLEIILANIYGEQLKAIEDAGYPGTKDRWTTSTGTPQPGPSLEIDLWRFPTDWRLNQRNLADNMKDRIDWLTTDNPEIARTCEVDIVSHSNGGVISATYVQVYRKHSQNKVHRLLTSAAPYLGAVRAIGAHTSGYIFGIEENLKQISPDWGRMIAMARNLPATYSLLPSRTYWKASTQFEIGSNAVLQDLNGTPLSGYDATVEFMTRPKIQLGLGRNGPVWTTVAAEVNDQIDDWREWDGPPQIFRHVGAVREAGQDIVHTIVGWYNDPRAMRRKLGEGDVRVEPGDTPLQILYRAAQMPIIGLGDTTVPLSSATLGRDPRVGKMDYSGVKRSNGSDNPWIEEFEVFPCEHVGLVTDACQTAAGVKALDRTVEMLKSGYEATAADNPSAKRILPLAEVTVPQNLIYITSSGRIGVHVEDFIGNHTGPEKQDGFADLEYLIPGLGYFPNDFGVVVSLADAQVYTITVKAVETESVIQVVRMLANETADRDNILFPNVVVQQGGGLRFVLQNGVTPNSLPLDVDQDGDGGYETTLVPVATVTSASLAPAIPTPVPLRVEKTVLTSQQTDAQVRVTFSDVGPTAWTWIATKTANWISLDAGAGQVPTAIKLTLKSTTLPEGVHSDTLDVSLSTGAYTVTYPVVIDLKVVGERALSSITVSPLDITLARGESKQFIAEGFDQIGDPFVFNPVWSATGGSIDQTGFYTAGDTAGDFLVTAADQSGPVVGTVKVTIAGTTGIVDDTPMDIIPDSYKLYQNYPNPFNPVTQIIFDVKATTNVRLTVFDIMGREIQTIVDQEQSPGRYAARFDATNLPSGPYLLRIQMGGYTKTITMIVLK
ncbi:MAG: hypothetical protein BMS9Abin05_1002 [Rhodothermia bacterium]|nr:MAG: hypothetical protein BMS9Abin05_1002 [Rhodothermia bacterium]